MITVTAQDKYITLTQSYNLTVQVPVTFTATVSPNQPIYNDGSKLNFIYSNLLN
jgi:hypothetical protein